MHPSMPLLTSSPTSCGSADRPGVTSLRRKSGCPERMSETAAAQQMEMVAGSVRCSFVNVVTDTTYRLRVGSESWRITKSRPSGDSVILRHLRGQAGPGLVPQDLIARLVRGDQGIPAVRGDPVVAFAAVVRWDLDRTYDVLVALARESRQRFDRGVPGFRRRAPILRAEAAAALAAAETGCRSMALAWMAAGLTGDPLPWMTAATEDAAERAGS